MPRHRRGRSLSEALTLEQSEEGDVVISSISNASDDQGLKEGDTILGATINFDDLSKEEVLNVLKLMEPFSDKMQVLTRSNLSKSLGNLNESSKSPDEMLKDSYSKLYNAKIKRFIKDDPSGTDEGCMDGKVATEPTPSMVIKKHDAKLPRLGVDFGLLKSRTPSMDADADSQSDARGLTDSTLDLPSLGLGPNGLTRTGVEAPRINLDARSPELNVSDLNRSGMFPGDPNANSAAGINLPNTDCAPEMGMDLKGSAVNTPEVEIDLNRENITGPCFNSGVPKVDIEGINPDFNMPKFKVPRLSLSGPHTGSPECEVRASEVETPKISSGKLSLKQSRRQKMPDLNVDDLSSFRGSSKFNLSGELPEKPGFDVNGADADVALGDVKVSLKKPKTDLKSPDLDLDAPIGLLTSENDVKTPKLNLKKPKIKSGAVASDVNLSKADLKGKNLDTDTLSANAKSLSRKYKAPTFTMPKFDLPDIQVPDLNGDLKQLHADLPKPDFKGAIGSTDFEMPNMSLQKPKLDLSGPDTSFEMPSSELKKPKFNLSGTLPKGLDLDKNTDLKSPDLSLSLPKGRIDAPNVESPDIGLKTPNLEVNTPDLNTGLGKSKFKIPKFGLPNVKGPEIDGSLDGPNIDVNAPDVNFKGPKTDLNLSGPSGKLKKPNFNMPDFGFSGPKLDGPNLDLRTPDLDVSGPNLSGGINAPDIDIPKFDVKGPKMDLNAPDVGLDMPSGKVKMPELHAPDWDLKAPSGKLKMPKFNLSGTLPKGPNLDLNADMKSPNLSLNAPKIKGGMDGPDLDLPNMKLKDPKLDVSAPDLNIGSPKTKFPKLKLPKFGLPNLKGPEIDGSLDGPKIDVNAPDVNLKGPKTDLNLSGPSGKLKKPNFNMPDFGFSGPKLDGPNLDLRTPDLDVSGPNLSGGINAPDIDVPKFDVKGQKMDLNAPDVGLDMPSGKVKMPELHAPDWDLKAPSGKLKMPKMNLSGTLPKGPNLDLNADMRSPNLSLNTPKIKGGMDGPNLDLPNMNLKAPKYNVSTPDVRIGSPKTKLKMPKMNLPSVKGPAISGNIDGPDIGSPSMNIKGSKTGFEVPDVEFGNSSKKFKMPNLKIPDVGFSHPEGPDMNSPNLNSKLPKGSNLKLHSDLKAPDMNLKLPKTKGGFDSPKLGFPDMDVNAPDASINFPDVNTKKPKVKIPKGLNVDIKENLQGPDLNTPNMDVNVPKISGPKVKGPAVDTLALNLPDVRVKGSKLRTKQPDVGLNGSVGQPDLNFTSPQVRGYSRGPGSDMNIRSLGIDSSQADIDLPDKRFKLPSLKLPQFGSPSLENAGADIDFGGSMRPTNLHFSPPNAKFNLKPGELRGNATSLNVGAPNMNLSTTTRSPQMQLRNPHLNVDDPSLRLKKPSYRNHRSDMSLKRPDLDIDQKYLRPKARFSYPAWDADQHHHIDVSHSDLNIDDFTGKDHVLRARGSQLDLRASQSGHMTPPSRVGVNNFDSKNTRGTRAYNNYPNAQLPTLSQNSQIRVPDIPDGYFVTVFPDQIQNTKIPNRKYNMVGGPDFHPRNLDLEVPNKNDLKGSTFLFSNLV